MLEFAKFFDRGLTYADFLQRYGTDEHRRRWQHVHAQVQLTDPQRELLAGFRREMRVLCVAGTWCGDCVQQCPIFEHFEAASPRLHIRYFDRDAEPELSSALAVCGAPRVPAVLFLSEDGFPCGQYGDRTLAKYRQMVRDLEGAACPTGLLAPDQPLLAGVVQDWLDEFERVQWILRTSGRLRQKHGD